MIVTPEMNGLNRLERNIAPPMAVAITIPLAINLQPSMFDGYTIYVCQSAFTEKRDTGRVVKAIAKAVANHFMTMTAFEVE
jgi:hypothetical protein